MIIFIILAIILGMLTSLLYKAEHNFKKDGICEGTISRIILEDSGDTRYYIKACINGAEREGETYTYKKSPKSVHKGQAVKTEYFFGKNNFVRFSILEEGFVKRSVKGAYIIFGLLSIISLIIFFIML